ncbi:MAG: hypothetical protein AB7O67_07210 [Vicinamibacterales bacterium]
MSRFPAFDLDRARADVTAASAGGAPFLVAFALTLGATGLAAFALPVRTAALVTLFQGNVALPLAFWLERRMGHGPMAADNPLRSLSVQLAMSQVVALPAALMLYALAPWTVAAGMAAIGGGHFLPYAWLQRTRWYAGLGVTVSLGAVVVTAILREAALPWTLLFIATTYAAGAAAIRREAWRLEAADRHAATAPA